MFTIRTRDHLLLLLACVGLALYAYFGGFFAREIVTEIAILAILAISLDILAGYGGMVSLMHGALMGTTAYIFGASTVLLGLPIVVASVLGALGAVVLGGIIGLITVRTSGIYFIMATLAFGQMAYTYVFREPMFGGNDGMAGLPRLSADFIGMNLGSSFNFSVLAIIIMVIAYVLGAIFLRSNLGHSLQAQAVNPERTTTLGYNLTSVRSIAFAYSGLIASLAGLLAAQHTQFISPELMHWTTSGEVLIVVIFGGLATLIGPVLGAVVFVLLKHQIDNYTDYWHLFMGIILIAVIMLGRGGIYGELNRLFARWRSHA